MVNVYLMQQITKIEIAKSLSVVILLVKYCILCMIVFAFCYFCPVSYFNDNFLLCKILIFISYMNFVHSCTHSAKVLLHVKISRVFWGYFFSKSV